MERDYYNKAEQILDALANGSVPISWHEMHRKKLVIMITKELEKMEVAKEKRTQNDYVFATQVFTGKKKKGRKVYITNKDCSEINNLSKITRIYINKDKDNCTVKADFENGNSCQLGQYGSRSEAQGAIDIVASMLKSKPVLEVCPMPQDDMIIAHLNLKL